MKRLFALLLCVLLPAVAVAESFDNVVRAELRPGWRLANGDHIAALHLHLAPGWKTYWRAPGESGIPPLFDWRGGRGVTGIAVEWPAPQVFWQSGMRSVGYKNEVVLPLRISLRDGTGDMKLKGVIDIGICKEVCMPHRVRVQTVLPGGTGKPDPVIAASLADVPFTGAEGGVRSVSCSVSPAQNGMTLRVVVDMPKGTGREETVIEFPDPQLNVSEPQSYWENGHLIAETHVSHWSGKAFAMDRSAMRLTVLNGSIPLDIHGCGG